MMFPAKEYKIVVVGLDNAGKTTTQAPLGRGRYLGKVSPFVYTKCQAIYAALLNIPANLSTVMSARHVSRRGPIADEAGLHPGWYTEGRVVEEFVMDYPVPPYLFALAAEELGHREVGPRTKVYGEVGELDAAVRDFAGAKEMVRAGEALFRVGAAEEEERGGR